ncbi:MAG: ATP-binding protein [Cyanobacteria bacterium J06632_3]
MQHLLVITDSEGRRVVELNEDSSSIGRDSGNSITIDSYEISRQHAMLLRVTYPGKVGHVFRITDGNLQGKPSTNGLFVNGKRTDSCILKHGDEIALGTEVTIRYLATKEKIDPEQIVSDGEDSIEHLLTLSSSTSLGTNNSEVDQLDYSILARLASFPELFIHPIVEFSLAGDITYRNPAAIQQFPELTAADITHPILSGVVEDVTHNGKRQSIREIVIGEQVFEQSIEYIPQSDLIRSYLVDITERRRIENELKAVHKELAATVEKRTLQFNEASSRLKQEEKALVASYATNRALLDAIPDPMFRINHAGTIVNFKVPKQHTLPFDPGQHVGDHISTVVADDVAKRIQSCIGQALKSEQMQVLEFKIPGNQSPDGNRGSEHHDSGNGTTLHFEARIAVSAPNETMVIVRDITERKRGEEEIIHALDYERDLNEMKTRFVSMTSHEFRTPLATILSSAELIEHYGDRCTPEKKQKYLKKIKTATKHMTSLLNDVLLINMADAGKAVFNPAALDLTVFCHEIIEELQITTERHQLLMESELANPVVPIDKKLMRHILTNLMSNAINYSPDGGDIVLSLDNNDSKFKLQVKDSGIGIPEKSQATLFESFVRGSNVGTISGTGLGLAIVKKSVDLHQGQISCQSVVNEGTTFTVQFPLKPEKQPHGLEEVQNKVPQRMGTVTHPTQHSLPREMAGT